MALVYLNGFLDGMFAAIRYHHQTLNIACSHYVRMQQLLYGFSIDSPVLGELTRGFIDGHNRTRERLEGGAIREREVSSLAKR